MNQTKLVAVGSPPFRQQVAGAAGRSPEGVLWIPNVDDVQGVIARERPAVVVLGPEVTDMDALGVANYSNSHSPTTILIVVRTHEVNGLLPSFMRAGIRDLVDLSKGSGELQEVLTRAQTWAAGLQSAYSGDGLGISHTRGSLFTVFSSKGGTGKTFVATNLAAAIAQRTQTETAIVDLDLSMGDVFSYFGGEPRRPLQDLFVLSERADRDSILSIGTELSEHLHGFAAPADVAAERVSGDVLVRGLQLVRGIFPVTVIDVPAAYDDEVLAALDDSERILLLASLDVVGIKHLGKSLETLGYIGIPKERLMIVLNRADSKVGLEPDDVERIMGIKVDAMIPSSRLVPTSLNQGRPVYLEQPKSPVAKAIGQLAAMLVPPSGPPAGNGSHKKTRLFKR